MSMKIPTFIINLDEDRVRLDGLLSQVHAEGVCQPIRIRATDGRALSEVSSVLLTQNTFWPPPRGNLGCFLSHTKAWEAVATLDSAFCIVLEDDAVLRGLARLRALDLPQDADLVFLNNSMSPGSRYDDPEVPLQCLSLAESIRELNKIHQGVDTVGYLLTPRCAKVLLEAVARDFLFGHVDWRLLRYALHESDLVGEFAGTRVDEVVRQHHNPRIPPAWGLIKAYCLNTPIVIHIAAPFPSSRLRINNPTKEI